jgi:hypothetical protein
VKRRAALITDAEPSQDDQLRSRQIQYASMMGIRIICLVAATMLVAMHAPLLWLWLPICIAGMVILPWTAVLIANDRPPKKEHTLRGKLIRRRAAVDAPSVVPEVTATPHHSKIINSDGRDSGEHPL